MKDSLDFMFCHPPAVLNGQKSILDADVAYSYQFVCNPVGQFNMANNLERAGFQVRILNLGERMLQKQENETLEDIIKRYIDEYHPMIIGIDLHWWVHSAGAVETAKLIKKIDRRIVTMLGGITSSYFAEEIIRDFKDVDYVLRGECDESIVAFVKYIKNEDVKISEVSGLVYRDKGGNINKNEIVPPSNLREFDITRYDLLIEPPVINPDRAIIPITRGCVHGCTYCGASNSTFPRIMGRERVCFLSPEVIVDMILKNKQKGRKNIYLYGDVQGGGADFVDHFFDLLIKADISGVHLVIEFFNPPKKEIIKRWLDVISRKGITLEATISPDSGNFEVRKSLRRYYTNDQLVDAAKYVYEVGIPLSVYFMLGCPSDSPETIEETLQLSDRILYLYSKYFTYNSVRHEIIGYEFMQVPDLGSEVFRNPKQYGIEISFDSFSGLVDLIKNAVHWSQLIGFKTQFFDKGGFVAEYYKIKKSVCEMYHKYGIIDEETYRKKVGKLDRDNAFYNDFIKKDLGGVV